MRALVLLLIMPLLAGCASSGSPLDTRFPVAEHRFADQATEAFEQTETLRLGSGPHTLRIAASGNDGFAVYLRAPAEREPYSGVMLAGPLSGISVFGTFRINDLEFATQGKAGSWTLTFGCEGPCTYTIAIDEGLDIPDRDIPARGRASGSLTDDHTEHTLDVGRPLPTISASFATQGAISVDILDAEGEQVTGWNFQQVYAVGWTYQPYAEGATGEWTVAVGCNDSCDYALDVR